MAIYLRNILCFCITLHSLTLVAAGHFDDDIKMRLEAMPLCVTPKMNKVVSKKLHEYLYLNDQHTQAILDRMAVHFPMIEQKLRSVGFPQDLKYMVLVESEIDPLAESKDGALGLWQLMPKTARSLGLQITPDIDERRDPELSTDAAILFLKILYDRFKSWELVMAAYNGGASRVRSAQKKAGHTSDFWKMKKFLPKESADFISRFTAAAYLGRYYYYHFFQKPSFNLDFHLTQSVIIHKHTRFTDIAKKTGLPIHVLMELNPMYKKSYIPASAKGHKLILPQRVVPYLHAEAQFIATHDQQVYYNPDQYYTSQLYQADKHEDIYSIAKKLKTNAFLLKYWNTMEKLVTEKVTDLVCYKIK